ncbi:MAG: CHAT domain-containing protein, partial [Chloroflexota bacterium]
MPDYQTQQQLNRKRNQAERRLTAFSIQDFITPGHLLLAQHAAFPLVLTPTMLYQMWATFQRDETGVPLNIPAIAVSDLILSSLLREVDFERYEMDKYISRYLLRQLGQNPNLGQKRYEGLRDFMGALVRQFHPNDEALAQYEELNSLILVAPHEAVRKLARNLNRFNEVPISNSSWVTIAHLYPVLETILETSGLNAEDESDPDRIRLGQEFELLRQFGQIFHDVARNRIDKARLNIAQVLNVDSDKLPKVIEVAGVEVQIPPVLTSSRNKELTTQISKTSTPHELVIGDKNVHPTPFIIHPPADLPKRNPDLIRACNEIARHYASKEIVVTDDNLQRIGQALWQMLPEGEGLQIAKGKAGRKILPIIIESDSPAIQQLPWETLYHREYGFLGQHPGFTLSRRLQPETESTPNLETGPLRILLFTSLPDDLDAEKEQLDVDAEQASVLEALTPWVNQGLVKLDMPDDGRFSTLKAHLDDFQPHMIFLSGHGRFYDQSVTNKTPYGTFLFESETGLRDLKSGMELATAFQGIRVQAVVLSACESGKASSGALNNGLTRQLRQIGIPHVIGMRESFYDRAGIQFAQAFCEAVAHQERIDVALQLARAAITQPFKDYEDRPPQNRREDQAPTELSFGQWSLPSLLSQNPAQPLIRWDFQPSPPRQDFLNQSLETITLPPEFVGRRRELRDLKSRI